MNYSRNAFSDTLAVVSASSSIAAWQEQLDWALRIIASLLAVTAGIYSIVARYRNNKNEPS